MNTASDLLEAFLLTLLAGLSTGIGGAFVFFAKTIDRRLLCVSLGVSAGVLFYVSLVEILHESAAMLSEVYGDKTGMLYAMLSFFGGILLIAVIDKLIPCEENPHEMSCQVRPGAEAPPQRTGFTALTGHSNFPVAWRPLCSPVHAPGHPHHCARLIPHSRAFHRVLSSMPPAAEDRHALFPACRRSPLPWQRIWFCCPLCPPCCRGCSLAWWPASWCSSPWMSCCPARSCMASIT